MTGSLQIKNNKYYLVLNLYRNGKRKVKWINTDLPVKGNKTKAQKLLRETLKQYEEEQQHWQELENSPALMPFTDAIKKWYAYKTADIECPIDPITQQGYEIMMRVQIFPYFTEKGYRLCDINKQNLQAFINEKATKGKLDGSGGLSGVTLRKIKSIINMTLTYYEAEGIIDKNPCRFLRLPPKERHEASFYSMAQIEELLAKAKEHNEPLYPMIRVTALYGLRRSEALGLCWDCVNFENETFTIRRTVTKVSKVVAKDKTKNITSRRSFPMTAEIKELFLSLKAQQKKDKKFYGNTYCDNNYVFRWEDGKPFAPDYVTRKFRKLLKEYGMPHIRFHELRHSAASNLLSMGFTLKDVQEWLGHSDIKTTANIYGHLDAKRKISMANALSMGSADTYDSTKQGSILPPTESTNQGNASAVTAHAS